MSVTLANAPVSYGVFELTVGTERYLASAERLLDEVAAAGYAGIDLGPVGYLGRTADLGRRLADRGLGLAGGYVELAFHDPEGLGRDLAALDDVLEAFDAARPYISGPAPLPTLAAAPSAAHRRRPGQSEADHSIGLNDAGWDQFRDGLNSVVARCRGRGYEPTFHPHAGSFVEAPWEIERVLAGSDVGLCLDTGHLLVGGGDPVALLHQWAKRLNHVHLKDVRMALMRQIVTAGGTADQIWTRGVFCALGHGELDLDGILAGLRSIDFGGWIVVEQDVFSHDQAEFEQAASDQRANREVLAERGL